MTCQRKREEFRQTELERQSLLKAVKETPEMLYQKRKNRPFDVARLRLEFSLNPK